MGAHRDSIDGKIRSEFQRRQQAQDELVATLRKYSAFVLAALVLLPVELVGVGVTCTVLFLLARRLFA